MTKLKKTKVCSAVAEKAGYTSSQGLKMAKTPVRCQKLQKLYFSFVKNYKSFNP